MGTISRSKLGEISKDKTHGRLRSQIEAFFIGSLTCWKILIVLWCNGSTSGFGPEDWSSSLCGTTKWSVRLAV